MLQSLGKKLGATLLASLLIVYTFPTSAIAQRGSSSSSGSRSSFSGGSSSSGSRSSFSGGSSSSGRSSFSGGSSSSGKSSFSSGGSSSSGSKSSFSGGSQGSKSSASPSSGGSKSSFSGGSSSSSGSKSSASPSSGGSKSSFSGGSSSGSPSSGSSSGKSSLGGKSSFSGGSSSSSSSSSGSKSSFSGGSKTTTTTPLPDRKPASVSRKPAASDFNSLARNDSVKAESRRNYERSQAPASTYKTPKGEEKKIDPKDKEISYLRGRLDEQRWVNRNTRCDTFYSGYYSRPVVIYNDCYHPYWNYWLLSQSIDTMAMWCWHHQMSMDAARLNAMYAQNAGLQARVAALEAQNRAKGIQRDPTYMPPNVDPDLAYNDNYVNAAFNPTPKSVTVYEYDDETSVGEVFLWVFLWIPLMLMATGGLIYLVFYKRY